MEFEVMHPDPLRRVELAIEDIKAGRMVILVDDEDRENEGDIVIAADAITPDSINFMARHARGLICLTLTSERVRQLQLPMMASNNQSPYHTAFTVSIEAREGVSTGISAADRARTVLVAIDPSKGPQDIVTPGHIFPLRARDGGVLVRTGQTEGSVDLARMAGRHPSGVICEIMRDDGTMARLPDLLEFGQQHQIRVVAVADLIRWRMRTEVLVERLVEAPLPMQGLNGFSTRAWRSQTDGGVHIAVYKGEFSPDRPVLARVQAFCPSGDIFGSAACDCRAQLDASLRQIDAAGEGVLLYMHVGAIGQAEALAARLASHLQVLDQRSANARGGELREFGMGAQMLVDLGLRRIRLMTNNPTKIVGLEGYGLEVVERVPLQIPPSAENASFLRARRNELGHLLPLAG